MPDSTLATLDHLIEAFTAQRKNRALTPVKTKLERAMEKVFRAQGRAFIAALNHRAGVLGGRIQEAASDITPPNWEAIYNRIAADTAIMELAIQAGIDTALPIGAQHTMADFSVAGRFDLANPRAAAYLETHAAEAVTQINGVTKEKMRAIITRGVAEGRSYDSIAREIRDSFEGFSTPKPQQHIRSRAHLVAVTEAGNAYEAGSRSVADDLKAAGLQMEKSWLTVGDTRVDPNCASNEGAGWIDLDDDFPSGVQQPLDHPACRCTMLMRRQPGTQEIAA